MDRHLSTEQLSSYLDGEIGSREARVLEGHLANCATCREELASLQRVVIGLRRLERPPVPPALPFRVRQEVAAAGEPRGVLQYLHLLPIDFELRPAVWASVAMGLVVIFSLFLVSGIEQKPTAAQQTEPDFVVTVAGSPEPPLSLPQTTSEVAGREFVYAGGRWIQRGFENERPVVRVAAQSPEGQAMLSKYSDLGILLADGSRVMLMYRLYTVELSGS
jgi:Putative zinc-finger